tara:strand:- start:49 stop:399 length:351 start_codon:yes stop_codon:yes gene_type:complete
MLYSVLIFLFVLICIMLVGIILLQSSKTGGMGGAIGGQSAMNEAFGGEGADKLLVRITGGLAFAFMSLAIMISLYPISENADIDNPVLARNKGKETELVIPSDIESIDQENSQSGE